MRLVTQLLGTISVCFAGLTGETIAAQTQSDEAIEEKNAEPAGSQKSSRLTISPYLWGPTVGGTVSLDGLEAPINLGIGELASGAKIGGMGHIEYSRGPIFVYAEAIGFKFADSEFADLAGQPVRASALLGEAGAGFTRTIPLNDQHVLDIAPYVGVRYVRLEASVSGPAISLSSQNQWVDPVAGLVGGLTLDKRWKIVGKVDFAGFSITENSYRNVAAGLEYRANSALSLVAGYRSARGRMVSDRGLNADIEGNGPIIGLRYSLAN